GGVHDWVAAFHVQTSCWPSSPRTVAVCCGTIFTDTSSSELQPEPNDPPAVRARVTAGPARKLPLQSVGCWFPGRAHCHPDLFVCQRIVTGSSRQCCRERLSAAGRDPRSSGARRPPATRCHAAPDGSG